MEILIKDSVNDQVLIAFVNSREELEYSVFTLEDGGVFTIAEDETAETALQQLVEELEITVDDEFDLEK